MRTWGNLLLTSTLLLLTGCTTGPLAPYTWQGTGQTSYATYAVKLTCTLYGNNLIGIYYLKGATDPSGKAEGTINSGTVTMKLTPNTVCAFDFAGTHHRHPPTRQLHGATQHLREQRRLGSRQAVDTHARLLMGAPCLGSRSSPVAACNPLLRRRG